jgi:hypothetical protein
MMPQKMLEQPLNWLSISLSMAQRRLVSLTSMFAFLNIMGLDRLSSSVILYKNKSVIEAKHVFGMKTHITSIM